MNSFLPPILVEFALMRKALDLSFSYQFDTALSFWLQ